MHPIISSGCGTGLQPGAESSGVNADRIVVLKDGMTAEQGNPEKQESYEIPSLFF